MHTQSHTTSSDRTTPGAGPRQPDAVGERIKQAREDADLTQPQLARRAGISESLLAKVETGGRPATTTTIAAVARALAISPARLTGVSALDDGEVDTVKSLLELGRMEHGRSESDVLNRRQALAAGALTALGLPDPDAVLRRLNAQTDATVRVGPGEVNAVRAMTRVLGDAAAELGGGTARQMAVTYLHGDVSRWLQGRWTENTGRQLYAATSEMVHLIGWMNQDAGHQNLAEDYYNHAYVLAGEAGDPELACTALRGRAIRAIDLHRPALAVRLAEQCVEQARGLDPKALAYYETTLADAAALDGNRHLAMQYIAASQTHIERAADAPGASWASHFSIGRWAHHTGMILARLGDNTAAEDHLNRALDIHGLDRRRSRAIVLADLGTVRLRRDDQDGALTAWSEFLDTAAGVHSVKIRDAVVDLQARLERLNTAAANELAQRAAGAMAT
ncbi:helix-turn-helix domain-containing protein [Streptomyces sp. NRRL B-24484]|uniref:helix-turn-helix domain-containing protein n=1 Tax=Streptomyces sp. NRRL B-24484 TaxID=1463833 RepID=UPI001F3D6C8B|nr:helix-turn-helix transcriptional regulator [Streptomyces sp. NRRL B-24484]